MTHRATGAGLRICALAAMAYAGLIAQAAAQQTHGKWESRSADGKCFAVSLPESTSGTIAGRDTPYLSIQNHPSEGVRGSVAILSGTKETAKGDASLDVDGQSFDLLPFEDAAFARSGAPESSLIAAMRRGRLLTVTWKLPNNASAVDRYSLDGFTAAKTAIDSNCR